MMVTIDGERNPLVAAEGDTPASYVRPKLAVALIGVCSVVAVAHVAIFRLGANLSDESNEFDNPVVKGWKTRLASVRKSLIDEEGVTDWDRARDDGSLFTSGPKFTPVKGSGEGKKRIDWKKIEPEMFGRTATKSGSFETWHFILPFDDYTVYFRRFGVDMPTECLQQSCPLLVDFHGSYDSLFSQRAWTGWHDYLATTAKKFVLLTPEGSPDALHHVGARLNDCNTTADDCTGSSVTSWNVLGWGKNTKPLNRTITCEAADREPGPATVCFSATLKPSNAYPCFGTHLEHNPMACRFSSYGDQHQIPRECQSASGANDYDYLKVVMKFVVRHYNVDAERIYLSGQSMGGMSSLQFAMRSGDYDLDAYRPAAIAPCSCGAARSHYAKLDAEVPAMVMWGYEDDVSPVTLWSGYDRGNTYLPNTDIFKNQVLSGAQSAQLTKAALNVTGAYPTNLCGRDYCSGFKKRKCCLMLWANALTGGELLKGSNAEKYFENKNRLACRNDMHELPAVDGVGFMWEGVLATLRGVVGDRKLTMANLEWKPPDASLVPEKFQKQNDMLCALVPNKNEKDIRICIYQGGHTMPWKSEDSNEWIAGGGQVFHDFVWKGFLKEGELKRS